MAPNVEADARQVEVSCPQQIWQKSIMTLDRQLDEAIGQKPEVIDLNMSGVEILDSFGLNWLIEAQARLTSCGIKLELLDANRLVGDILRATRLDTRFTLIVKAEGERNA